jgi:uncharacterized protein YwqG
MNRHFLLHAAVLALCCACSRAPAPAELSIEGKPDNALASLPPVVAIKRQPDAPNASQPSELAIERKPDSPRASLPAELAPFRAALDRSELTYVAISASKESGSAPWRSKFLGTPYFPKGQQYPRDPYGKPLVLLAQINFSEMPRLPDYPSTGIVQFFAADEETSAHIYGSLQYDEKPFSVSRHFDSMTEQRYFRVLYHPNVVADPAGQGTPEKPATPGPGLPVMDEATLRFETRTEAVAVDDYRFQKFLGKSAADFFQQFGARETALAQAYMAYAGNSPVAKIGGYTKLVQNDPRESRGNEDWLILLEIRSAGGADKIDIMWGDSGVGVFFIRRDDLKRRDFSKVAYHWDNH